MLSNIASNSENEAALIAAHDIRYKVINHLTFTSSFRMRLNCIYVLANLVDKLIVPYPEAIRSLLRLDFWEVLEKELRPHMPAESQSVALELIDVILSKMPEEIEVACNKGVAEAIMDLQQSKNKNVRNQAEALLDKYFSTTTDDLVY